ncbi:hypothetical protein AcW1_001429 [Taiwanofungus camphoratus]|nr:hypothetical protein AcW1_001429 [Antrodia cinnamomea]
MALLAQSGGVCRTATLSHDRPSALHARPAALPRRPSVSPASLSRPAPVPPSPPQPSAPPPSLPICPFQTPRSQPPLQLPSPVLAPSLSLSAPSSTVCSQPCITSDPGSHPPFLPSLLRLALCLSPLLSSRHRATTRYFCPCLVNDALAALRILSPYGHLPAAATGTAISTGIHIREADSAFRLSSRSPPQPNSSSGCVHESRSSRLLRESGLVVPGFQSPVGMPEPSCSSQSDCSVRVLRAL